MAIQLQCSEPTCRTWLDAEVPEGAYFLLTRFPQDLVRCLMQLTLGATAILCPNGHTNILHASALCVDQHNK